MLEIWFYSVLSNLIDFIIIVNIISITLVIVVLVVVGMMYINNDDNYKKMIYNKFTKPFIIILVVSSVLNVLTPNSKFFAAMLITGPVKTHIIQSDSAKKVDKVIDLSIEYLQNKVQEK